MTTQFPGITTLRLSTTYMMSRD